MNRVSHEIHVKYVPLYHVNFVSRNLVKSFNFRLKKIKMKKKLLTKEQHYCEICLAIIFLERIIKLFFSNLRSGYNVALGALGLSVRCQLTPLDCIYFINDLVII